MEVFLIKSSMNENAFLLHDVKREFSIEQIHAIYYSELTNDHSFKGEQHSFWEFMYIDSGYVIGHIESNNMILEKGQCVLIHPDDFHDLYCNGKDASNIVNISFVCNFEPLKDVSNLVFKITPFQSNILKSIFSTLDLPKTSLYKLNLYPLDEKANFGTQHIIGNLLEILILDFYKQNLLSHQHDKLAFLNEDDITKDAANVVSVITSNINTKIDLEFISSMTGYTHDRIRKAIKQHYNVSLKVLVNQIKINKAKVLLREADMNISEIADFLGFSRIGYFSDVFYHVVGMRPIDYITSVRK